MRQPMKNDGLEIMTRAKLKQLSGPARTLIIAAVLCASTSTLPALEAIKDEKALLKGCERKLCSAVNSRNPKGKPIACKLNKTWGKGKIKKGAKSKSIGWSFGDAQCILKLKLDRSIITNALTQKKYKAFIPPHTVKCEVETDEGVKPVRVVLSPRIKFKNGRARKIWLKVQKVKGPTLLKGLIQTTASIQDSIGIFHGEMIREVNEFLHEKCPAKYSKKKKKKKKKK